MFFKCINWNEDNILIIYVSVKTPLDKQDNFLNIQNILNGRRDSLRRPRNNVYPQKSALTPPPTAKLSRSMYIACGLKTAEFVLFCPCFQQYSHFTQFDNKQ
jgi:hypothetical protein